MITEKVKLLSNNHLYYKMKCKETLARKLMRFLLLNQQVFDRFRLFNREMCILCCGAVCFSVWFCLPSKKTQTHPNRL